MNELARAIHAELASACRHLLDEGVAPVASARAPTGAVGPLAHVLRVTDALWATWSSALRDLEQVESGATFETVLSRLPRRAVPSRRAYDWAMVRGKPAPLVWESARPARVVPRAPLAWLLHGVEALQEELGRNAALLDGSLEEATRFREGSTFGRAELEVLEEQSASLRRAVDRAARMRHRLLALAEFNLRPSPRPPHPFPRTRAWQGVRATLRRLIDPLGALPGIARDLFGDEPTAVQLPYLYQRWCGWKVVLALRSLGFSPSGDPIPALLLSGSVEFRRGDAVVQLLCDPRLVAGKPPLGGIYVQQGEVTPDLVLTTETPRGLAAFVLDPTLRTTYEARREKARYLELVKLVGARTVAGARVVPGPERSWAAAPISGGCFVDDWRGAHGTVPMHPCEYEEGPLLAWLGDLVAMRG